MTVNDEQNEMVPITETLEMGTLNELKEMLEPLGIIFDGDIEAIRAKLKEKTENLKQDTQMVKEDKEKLSAQLAKVTDKLQSAEYDCTNLKAQIQWLESKVLNSSGENKLLQKTRSQKEQIELKEKELENHKKRQEQLRKVLADKEMTNEEAFANCNALENDYRVSLEKLKKVKLKIASFESYCSTIRKKHAEDTIQTKNLIVEMKKELKLKKTVVDNFVPRKIRKEIDQRMRYDSKNDEYFIEPPENSSLDPPEVNRMLQFPMLNLTRFCNLKPMDNTFFTNENVLLLAPNLPSWPAKKFVPDLANPMADSLIKAAVKDMNNPMIINCDHKTSKFRITQNDAPSYIAIGQTLLLKDLQHTSKFVDFSVVPSEINIPSGSSILPLQIPKSLNGTKFTRQQLMAFPLIKYSAQAELSFEDLGAKRKNKLINWINKI